MQQQVSLDRLSTLATISEQRIIMLLSENKKNFPTDYNGICFVDYTWIFSNNILYGSNGRNLSNAMESIFLYVYYTCRLAEPKWIFRYQDIFNSERNETLTNNERKKERAKPTESSRKQFGDIPAYMYSF